DRRPQPAGLLDRMGAGSRTADDDAASATCRGRKFCSRVAASVDFVGDSVRSVRIMVLAGSLVQPAQAHDHVWSTMAAVSAGNMVLVRVRGRQSGRGVG